MMKKLVDGFYISGQVNEADIQAAARDGVAVIINNRCEGEAPDQPETTVVKAWAEAAGLRYHTIPIATPQIDKETLRAFHNVLQSADGSVYAYCDVGMRSALIWALVESARGDRRVEDILKAILEAGFDLSSFTVVLQEIHGQGL